MNHKIGIDLVEFADIKSRATLKFIKRILSNEEYEKYENIGHPKRKLEYLAGRFAVKEAYTKLYKKFDRPLNYHDVIVRTDYFKAPYIVSSYRSDDEIEVSLSHSPNYCVAICLLEKDNKTKPEKL